MLCNGVTHLFACILYPSFVILCVIANNVLLLLYISVLFYILLSLRQNGVQIEPCDTCSDQAIYRWSAMLQFKG